MLDADTPLGRPSHQDMVTQLCAILTAILHQKEELEQWVTDTTDLVNFYTNLSPYRSLD